MPDARSGGPTCSEARPAAPEGRRRGGPASPRDWRPAAPPGPDRQAWGIARGLAAGTSRAWSASACSRVPAPWARAGTTALRPRPGEELPSEGQAGPEGVPASAVGSLLFPNSEREPVPPLPPAQFAFAPKRRTEKLGEEGGGFSFAGTESVEGGTGVAGRRQGRGVIAPGRKPGPGARSGLWVPVCPQKLLLSAFHRRPKQKPRSRWDTVSGTGLEGRLSLASGKVNLGLRAQDVLKF